MANEETFKYSPAKHQYQCYFEGFAGATRLKQIFWYDQWDFWQHPLTNTKGYVLLEDYENKYQVKFIWSQSTLSEITESSYWEECLVILLLIPENFKKSNYSI
ncbi:hypothetical protein C1645_840176 [Glomus cerebriforme]|uniref:Uncharacterized protein n=1 Tax=Glomus cerebriforme TaxID=658196 RepID=A0A397S4L0_9GLOM|nr:hypothetical protein C1645_840176 [Glomus cerebriforme]